jgi:hypothetical protein
MTLGGSLLGSSLRAATFLLKRGSRFMARRGDRPISAWRPDQTLSRHSPPNENLAKIMPHHLIMFVVDATKPFSMPAKLPSSA